MIILVEQDLSPDIGKELLKNFNLFKALVETGATTGPCLLGNVIKQCQLKLTGRPMMAGVTSTAPVGRFCFIPPSKAVMGK